MPNNIYIGSRYVPLFDGDWVNTKSYDPLTIVTYGNNSYTSKKPVPAGTLPTDTNYWFLSGNYNGQISHLQQEIDSLNNKSNTIESIINSYKLFNVTTSDETDLGKIMNDNDVNYDGFIIPSGTYTLNTSYSSTKPIIIIAYPGAVINCAANTRVILNYKSYVSGLVLIYETSSTHIISSAEPPIGINGHDADGTVIKNCTVKYGNGGISILNASDCIIEDCRVEYSRSEIISGFWIGFTADRTKFINCIASHNVLDGFLFENSSITFENCIANDNGNERLLSSGALGACGFYEVSGEHNHDIIFDNCYALNNGECGYDLNCNYSIIKGCKADSNGLSGIAIKGFVTSIVDCVIENNGRNSTSSNPDSWGHSGIDIRPDSRHLFISNNNITDTGVGTQVYGINQLGSEQLYDSFISNNFLLFNATSGLGNLTDAINGTKINNNYS